MKDRRQKAEGRRQMAEGRWSRCCFLLTAYCILVGMVDAAAFDLIISGSGGEDVYAERFDDWSQRLRAALIARCHHLEERVILLNETGKEADGTSSMANIRKAVQRLADRVTNRDEVFLFLLGHGTYRRQVAKLNIPGPDLTAEDLDVLLKTLSARRIVIVNAASMSAPFVNTLSQKGRIVCTSTRSVDQRNATRFMGFFVQALEDGSSDQDRDERISVLEICKQASSLTEAWFWGEGMIPTENALLDDNGDGRGTRLSDIEAGDGALAARCFVMDFKVPEGIAPAIVEAYSRAIDEVQILIRKKSSMDSAAYFQQLEDKLLNAARLNQKIRNKK